MFEFPCTHRFAFVQFYPQKRNLSKLMSTEKFDFQCFYPIRQDIHVLDCDFIELVVTISRRYKTQHTVASQRVWGKTLRSEHVKTSTVRNDVTRALRRPDSGLPCEAARCRDKFPLLRDHTSRKHHKCHLMCIIQQSKLHTRVSRVSFCVLCSRTASTTIGMDRGQSNENASSQMRIVRNLSVELWLGKSSAVLQSFPTQRQR